MAEPLPILGAASTGAMRADAALRGTAARFEGLYVHVPFCLHKCHYCDFYSFVDAEGRQPAYASRLESELDFLGGFAVAPLQAVFFGGGTPTLLDPPLLRRALGAVARRMPLAVGAEWTVEANPETVDAEVAGVLASAGVNRVSLGAQSFDARHLKVLERSHDPARVGRAVRILREAGIGRISLDLIFGIPGQSPADWAADLDAALALGPDHLSCYALTYEPNTAMTARLRRGEFEPCDESAEADMLELAARRLADSGFARYEVSNWARIRDGDSRAEECRHNLLYWRNRDWLAAGPSASGHARGTRWKNVPRLGDWLATEGPSPVVDVERGGPDQVAGERLMMGLRLVRGIPDPELEEILALGSRGPARAAVIEREVRAGRMARAEGSLRFTGHGMMTANETLAALV